MARIVSEFIEGLGLENVTLCFNDWSGAQVILADGLLERVSALVLASCETEGNDPPCASPVAGRSRRSLPAASATRQTLSIPSLRRLPFVYGQDVEARSSRAADARMARAAPPAEIRRDVRKYIGDVAQGRRDLAAATSSLGGFDRPVLVVWDSEGKMMPNEEAASSASDFPDARLVEIADSYTLIPITSAAPARRGDPRLRGPAESGRLTRGGAGGREDRRDVGPTSAQAPAAPP